MISRQRAGSRGTRVSRMVSVGLRSDPRIAGLAQFLVEALIRAPEMANWPGVHHDQEPHVKSRRRQLNRCELQGCLATQKTPRHRSIPWQDPATRP